MIAALVEATEAPAPPRTRAAPAAEPGLLREMVALVVAVVVWPPVVVATAAPEARLVVVAVVAPRTRAARPATA
jgi:hypothetical protein